MVGDNVGAQLWSSLLKPGNPDSSWLAPGFSQTRSMVVILLLLLLLLDSQRVGGPWLKGEGVGEGMGKREGRP